MQKISMSMEGKCALTKHCFPQTAKTPAKRAWINGFGPLEQNDFGRIFTTVTIGKKRYYMDAITGSLYDYPEGYGVVNPSMRVGNLKTITAEKAFSVLTNISAPDIVVSTGVYE